MKSSIISAVVALAAFAKTPEEVPKEHRYPDAAQGGHLLVLQCGSDWCVRRVPGAREDFFHLNKILVYGDRMY